MNKQDMQQVSADELLSQLSGSSDFGEDELIEMFAYQDDQSKDFCIYHRQKAFCVPLHKIREYFTRHKKPIPPMTEHEELLYLRKKVQKLQTEAEASQEQGQIARPAPDVPDEPEEDTKVAEESPIFEDTGSADAPVVEEEPKVIPPKRDESIPPSDMREKKSVKEIRADLAAELKGVKLPKKKVTDGAQPQDVKSREEKVDNLLKKK